MWVCRVKAFLFMVKAFLPCGCLMHGLLYKEWNPHIGQIVTLGSDSVCLVCDGVIVYDGTDEGSTCNRCSFILILLFRGGWGCTAIS